MDGHFKTVEPKTDELSDAMRSAIEFLGGRKHWNGTVRGLAGLISRSFSIDSIGVVKDGVLIFRETLKFDNGETQDREWQLFETPHGIAVEGDDITLVQYGKIDNGALHITYRVKFGAQTFTYRDVFKRGSDSDVYNEGHASLLGLPVMKIIANGAAT